MQTFNTLYTNKHDLKKFLQKSNIKDCENSLIQVFCGVPDKQYITDMLCDISKLLPKSKLIGTTTAGEILEDKIYQNSTIISITIFDKTTLTSCLIKGDGDDFKLGRLLAKQTITPTTKALILFSDGLVSNGDKILDGINQINQNIIVAGGRGGDNGALKESFVFDKKEIINYGAVCVGLNSTELNVSNHYALDWQPIGKEMVITKAKDDRVYEIDGVSVKDIYRKYLGDSVADELPFSASEFPLLKNQDGLCIARAPIHVFDDGSVSFIGSLQEGDRVQFGFGDINMIMQKRCYHVDKVIQNPLESIFIYSCISRKNLLQNKIKYEIKPFSQLANTAGFFTYGEYFSYKDKIELLNMTMTILTLSEYEVQDCKNITQNFKTHKKLDNIIKDKHYRVISALTNLINSVTNELNQEHNKLKELLKTTEEIANKDYLTGAYNRYFFYGSAKRSFLRAKRDNTSLAIAILDIDKFKQINDTYGHDIGDLALIEVSNIIKNSLRASDLYARFGGEEFCILLEHVSYEDTKSIFEKMRDKFEKNSIKIDHTSIPCTVSIGVYYGLGDSLEQMITKADKLLYKAKNSGRNQIKIDS